MRFLVTSVVLATLLSVASYSTPNQSKKSTGIQYSGEGLRVLYLNDGKENLAGLTGTLKRKGNLHLDAVVTTRPADNAQISVGPGLAYDFKIKGSDIVISALVAFMIDINENDQSRKKNLICWGAELKF